MSEEVLKCMVVEDEAMSREMLCDMIRERIGNVEIVSTAPDLKTARKQLKKNSIDFVLLDIELPDGDGFRLLENMDELDFDVIFTTAHNHYALKAFQYSAVDYIIKPVEEAQLKSAVGRIRKKRSRYSDANLRMLIDNITARRHAFTKVALPSSDGYTFTRISDIVYCEADGNYTRVHTLKGDHYLISKPLKEFEELLPSSLFFRCHKSFLINLNLIHQYIRHEGGRIVMDNKKSIPLATRKREAFVERLNKL